MSAGPLTSRPTRRWWQAQRERGVPAQGGASASGQRMRGWLASWLLSDVSSSQHVALLPAGRCRRSQRPRSRRFLLSAPLCYPGLSGSVLVVGPMPLLLLFSAAVHFFPALSLLVFIIVMTQLSCIHPLALSLLQEIQAIIRQITASVTFLPLLSDTCGCWGGGAGPCLSGAMQLATPVLSGVEQLVQGQDHELPPLPGHVGAGTIDLLAYTDKETEVPFEWEESGPRHIANAADVKLRSFSTKVHNIEALVSYKADAGLV